MAGVRDVSDNRKNFYDVPFSRDPTAFSDPGNSWSGHHYNAVSQQQEQNWYGYYLPQQPEDMRQGVQEGVAAPLPSMPPPQAPLPPSLVNTPAWPVSDHPGANSGTDAYSGFNSYAQQHQGQEYAGYGVGELEARNSYTHVIPQAHAHPGAANGLQSYAQGYAGYTYMCDQIADGSMYYQAHVDHGLQKQGTEVYLQNATIYSSAADLHAPSAQCPHPGIHIDTVPHGSSGDYDTIWSADYGHSGDGEQTQGSWNHLNQGNYNYTGYPVPSSNANSVYGDVNSGPPGSMEHAQDYTQQWADYYSSLQAASQADIQSYVAPQGASGRLAVQVAAPTVVSTGASTPQQPPPPGTAVPRPSWQAGMGSHCEVQGSQVSLTYQAQSAGAVWNGVSNETFHSGHCNQSFSPPLTKHWITPPAQHQQEPLDFQNMRVSHNTQQQQSKEVKLHIVTNPRITGNVGGSNLGNETTNLSCVSVPAKNSSSSSVSVDTVADATLQPGMFPSSLRAYVERALSRCKDESQKAVCQNVMKDMITTSSLDGTLFTRDWDAEPLFAIPSTSSLSSTSEMVQQRSTSAKLEWNSATRLKTRWEAPAAEESDYNARRSLRFSGTVRVGGHDLPKDKDSIHSYSKWEKWQDTGNDTKTVVSTTTGNDLKNKGLKRFRKGLTIKHGENASSESDEERGHGVHLGFQSAADTSEENVRRLNRFKRFDRGKDIGRGGKGLGRSKGLIVGSASARRATALQLALNSVERQNGRAVEDLDWDSLTIRGMCQEVEKRYLRLTSAPDPQTVRPEDVLRRALEMVKNSTKSYLFKCEQLKSIRQDLTIQRIRDEFTVEVYESHARVALEAGDLPEYNQCQTQLKSLYGEGIKGCSNEFAAYSLLYILFNRGNSRDLLSAMARLTPDGRRDNVVKHALAVRNAVAVGNYTTFFRLYRTAPVLSPFLMDIYIEKMRFEAVKCMTRSYRPTIPVTSVARALGFTADLSGVEDCEEWLRAHGARFQFDSSLNELVVETKLSTTTLFVPEPEDVVPHGDANLALNDFFSRS